MAKTLCIRTHGCQMNVYDSARMADALAPLGFRPVAAAEGADMVILNTCHIRDKASEKVFSELGRFKALKRARERAGGSMLLAVAGCVAQAAGDEILARAPYVDIVIGPQSLHRLPELVARATRAAGQQIETEFPVESKFDYLPETAAPQGVSAFLTIQEGCDKFCTFCVVPYTRGAEYSRPAAQIIAEARRIIASGAREITLLGQNVNNYRGLGPAGDTWGLGRLIRAIAELPDLLRVRYTTSHPLDVDDELIAAHREVATLMPLLHLPVQSGADGILAAMNRRHSVADYRRTVDRLRRARADLAFSSDFIVGYPGETDADFAATLALVREIGFAQAFSFKYSPRPGTPAAAEKQVPDGVKSDRLAQLQELLENQRQAFNRAMVGQVLPVLFEKAGRHPGQLVGRSPYLQPVHAEAEGSDIGRLLPVLIERAEPNSLAGLCRAGVAA